jgi:hypothetical protein
MAAFYCESWAIDPVAKAQWDKVRGQYRASIAVAVVLSAGLLVGMATNAAGMMSIEGRPIILLAWGAGVAGAWWTVAQYRRASEPTRYAANAQAYARMPEAQYGLGPHRMTVGPAGLTLCGPHHDVTQRWSGIAGIRETSAMIYVQRRDRHCYMVPRRALGSPEAAAGFVARIRGWLDAAGHGDACRIREHLAMNDAPCRGCGYNLRGVTAGACPECGRELDAGLLG